MDTSNPSRAQNVDLKHWAQTAELTEVWHWKNPAVRRYSYFSQVSASSSRIDLTFANLTLLPLITDTTYLAGGISDHTSLQITLSLAPSKGLGVWWLYPGWVAEPLVFGGQRGLGCLTHSVIRRSRPPGQNITRLLRNYRLGNKIASAFMLSHPLQPHWQHIR